jgi:putative transposase
VLSAKKLELWKLKLGLSKKGCDLVDQIRTSDPARSVSGGAGVNVSGRYASNKMGHTIQFESHTCELPFIISCCEFPRVDDVLEYWDQPHTLRLRYQNKNGRMISTQHTPDYFLMHPDKAGFTECKLEETLIKLAKEQPNKFVLDSSGHWRCPPAEAEAAKYGLYYRVFSSSEIDRTLFRNTVFLEDFLRPGAPEVSEAATNSIVKLVTQSEGLSLSNLLALTAEVGESADTVYQLMATGTIYVDLSREALINHGRVQVYSAKSVAESPALVMAPKAKYVDIQVGEMIQWGDRVLEIANLDQQNVWLIGEGANHPKVPRPHFEKMIIKGDVRQATSETTQRPGLSWKELLEDAKPQAVKEAHKRYEVVMKFSQGEKVSNVPLSTLERWTRQYRKAQLLYGNGLIGLIPRWAQRGDRSTERLPARVMELMIGLIKSDYETKVQSGMNVVYGKLRIACAKIKEQPPSYRTFVNYVNSRPKHEQDEKRRGSRAAYGSEPFYYYLDKDTPRHGDRPFEIGHIDHTELDIELRDPITGQNFGRPWATFLTDACTRRILVAYLVFEKPSYRTCMMVLRECVRRFGRLPQTIVTDGGPDFKSIYFECLAAAFEMTVKRRPKARGRFGSVIENAFGVAHEMFVYNLQGNTQLTHDDVRLVTPESNPKELAVWTLGPLYESLCDWAYERYDTQEHGTLKESPRAMYVRTLAQTGHRNHRMIAYNEDFRILTLPTTPKGTAKNIQNKGVRINNEYYWHSILDQRELLEKQLPIKYEPYDYTIAWVYAKGKWVKCLSQEHYQMRGLTEAELQLRTAERAIQNIQFSRTAGQRAEASAEGVKKDRKREQELAEKLAILRAQQREDAAVRSQIDGVLGNSQPAKKTNEGETGETQASQTTVSAFEISEKVGVLEEYA